MSSTTTRLGLYKPDGTENVNRTTDINNNWDNIDGKMGFVPLTSSTHPASAYQGEAIYETDTLKAYVNSSAVASAATYKQLLVEGANFDSNITITSSAGQFKNSITTSNATFAAQRGNTTDFILSGRTVSASANNMFDVTADGKISWGSGSSATDTNLYRSAANTLKTDNSLVGASALDIAGNATFGGNLTISTGDLVIGSAIHRNQLHTATTVANTTTETAFVTLNIPASDAVVGAVYKIHAYGTLGVTGTPTITFRGRLGGAAGTQMVVFPAVTVRSVATDGYWDIIYFLTCVTTGVSGTWAPMMKYSHNFLTSVTTYTHLGPITGTPVTRDTTISNDLVLTATWSAASSSNTITCRGSEAIRVA